jgi:hypothetical protein
MFASPEKPFLLPKYAKAMACALSNSGPTSLPRPRYLGDPRVLNLLDLSAFEDFGISQNSSHYEDEGSPDSYQSSSEPRFFYTKASVDLFGSSGCNSSFSIDGSTSQST